MGFLSIPYLLVFLLFQEEFSKDPVRGEIIVFKTPEDNKTDYIKRLIGLGDKISMKSNKIYVNGMEIEQKLLNNENIKILTFQDFKY